MDNTVLDMFHGLYGPPDGNRKLQVSMCSSICVSCTEVPFSRVVCVLCVYSVVAGWLQY
jgi:hypothetical protein